MFVSHTIYTMQQTIILHKVAVMLCTVHLTRCGLCGVLCSDVSGVRGFLLAEAPRTLASHFASIHSLRNRFVRRDDNCETRAQCAHREPHREQGHSCTSQVYITVGCAICCIAHMLSRHLI